MLGDDVGGIGAFESDGFIGLSFLLELAEFGHFPFAAAFGPEGHQEAGELFETPMEISNGLPRGRFPADRWVADPG